MSTVANLQPEPAPVVACTISRDVQNFELLIDDMERELGENWGDLSFDDALIFLQQPDSDHRKFVAVAVDGHAKLILMVAPTFLQAPGAATKPWRSASCIRPISLCTSSFWRIADR